MKPTIADLFNKDVAQGYDDRNSKLSQILDCMHFLLRLVLKDLPTHSRILCVGAGTGAEILSLSRAFPEWRFVALDPSHAMLDLCRERVRSAGISERCEFIHGYIQDVPSGPNFDAALSMLVAHFVSRDQRLGFYQQMASRLRKGGYLASAEISFDLGSTEYQSMLKNWEAMQALTGATPESLAKLATQIKDMLTVLPPTEVEALLRQSGIESPVRFFQALMIHGWYGRIES